ncbi:MAG: DNA repair protein RecN [Alphaproteobacteria bacterium]|nr:DNA repair protein RecN [Alphaproteobacteria bacterium]
MLKSLSIRNVVLIDKLDMELADGLTVLSGETGAGKSVLLDSLSLLLGNRAETGMIRNGCDKLVVSGCFETADKNGKLASLCEEHNLDFAKEIVISRSLSQDGKGKIFFNDQPITQKLLKEIGGYLVEVHGQFDNQGLLNPATHLGVLDSYGGYSAALADMKEAFFNYKKVKTARENLQNEVENAAREEENLKHWIKEFESIKPKENEKEELEKLRVQLMNSEKLLDNFNSAYNALQGQSVSVREALRQAQTAVSRVNAMLDDKYSGIYGLLDTALINAEEAGEELETAMREITLNQSDIDAVEERLFTLKDLARKHRVEVDELVQVWQKMEEQLNKLEKSAGDLSALESVEKKAKENYVNKAKILHEERMSTALRLDDKMKNELLTLKMEKAHFVTDVKLKDEQNWNEEGIDDVCFMISTNLGSSLCNLNKIASGGELARLMLALKVNLGESSQIETMVFDEVDSGIGGATAQAVGEKLAKLGETVQVMVVTHSPQVAAFSDNHYKVEKSIRDGTTITTVYKLNNKEKQEEVARMLAGEVISDEARAAAKVLIGA